MRLKVKDERNFGVCFESCAGVKVGVVVQQRIKEILPYQICRQNLQK